ncbi:SGNH/GDSL hydrolase family protein [Actinomadura parmotrematis]|uniref:SGNH/GDSL hydrolase family protein n=1 Tax=Actinomadura parmotrematis TaxID=2864039 RepID=A0ABS7FLR2_9ACTN|nr:SGNH/GDSL hydrolase family protein [Actinomadura parmotrematis]MBW8481296.1 SGNH/GDSL hydrolase family protein [Actinomadura parmotrematis]
MRLPFPRLARRSLAAAVPALLGVLALAPAPAASAATAEYVALGDSMASGPLIPDVTGPVACGRSTHNYAHELTAKIGAAVFRDVTCSGADSDDMFNPQQTSLLGQTSVTVPPQLDALAATTTLVTLTVGGNDAGLIGVAEDCVKLDPTAATCRSEHTSGGVDQVAQRVDAFGPRLAAVLDAVHQRAPQARVVVTGYGLYIKAHGCWPVVPVLPSDADWLQGLVNRLNAVISAQAAAHGATYVDLVGPSAGHDACQSAAKKWIEGYVPVNLAAPLHPNRNGEAAYAQVIAGRL